MTSRIVVKMDVVNQTIRLINTTESPDVIDDVAIPDGRFYILGDGTPEDLLKVINDAIAAADPFVDNINFTLNASSHKVEINGQPGGEGNVNVDWTGASGGDAKALQEYLRYVVTPTVVPEETLIVAVRIHAGGVYEIRSAIDDLPARHFDVNQNRFDRGQVEAVFTASHDDYRLAIGYVGGERDSTFSQFADVDDAHGYITQGWRFRWYFDDTNLSPYVEVANPNGYHILKLDTARSPFLPRVRGENRYNKFRLDLRCFEVT